MLNGISDTIQSLEFKPPPATYCANPSLKPCEGCAEGFPWAEGRDLGWAQASSGSLQPPRAQLAYRRSMHG